MTIAEIEPEATAAPARTRSLILVTGSGRSGTSLVSGLLQRLGARIPAPEVPADESNPRGFGESQWVVDLHTRLLHDAGVQVSDARPVAWARSARLGMDASVHAEVRRFLAAQFREADEVVIKDPRLSWFIQVWREAAREVGATPRVIVMLRHPAAVVASKQRHYGGRQGEASRAAGWVNQLLFTERATRSESRVFIPYDRLLEDWTSALSRAGDALDLRLVRDAPAPAIRTAHEFIDVSLDRSRPDWSDLAVPHTLRDQADRVWALMGELTDHAGPLTPRMADTLDDLRAEYTRYYSDAELITYSSVAAARTLALTGTRRSLPAPVRRVLRRLPRGVRHALPGPIRRGLVRLLGR